MGPIVAKATGQGRKGGGNHDKLELFSNALLITKPCFHHSDCGISSHISENLHIVMNIYPRDEVSISIGFIKLNTDPSTTYACSNSFPVPYRDRVMLSSVNEKLNL